MTHRELLEQALALPVNERAKMAAELLESLDEGEEESPEEVQAAWAAEIKERVAAARAGEVESWDWRVVMDEIERDILGR